MKKIFISVFAIAIIGFILFFKDKKSSEGANEQPSAHMAARHVAAEGKVEAMPGEEVEVGSEITGKIEKFFVKEGDLIKKGEMIAIIDNEDIKARLRQAETEVAVAKARLEEVASGSRKEEIRKADAALEGAGADMELASVELKRFEKLYKEGIASEADLDQKRAEFNIYASRVKEAEETKTLLENGPKQETLKLNEDMVKQAGASMDYYRKLLDKTHIKAPISGKVIRKYAEEGELVNLASDETMLVAIANIDMIRINAEVDETDVGKINLGDPAEVTSDAYPGTIFKGEIEEISDYVGVRKVSPNNPTKNLDMKVVQVKIALKEKTPLKLGMTVNVKLVPKP